MFCGGVLFVLWCATMGGMVKSSSSVISWDFVRGACDHGEVLSCVGEELGLVEERFREQLDIAMPPVGRLCGYIERYRGKMLRPIMTILCGLAAAAEVCEGEVCKGGGCKGEDCQAEEKEAVEGLRRFIGESHRVLAAVCEMVHMATLVHDDVLDEADMRRRGATVNYLHGNEAAVLLGDYLISNAFHLCSTLGRPELNERIGAVTNSMCAGELLQLHHRGDWSIDRATYFEIIDRKTASLIGLCCELGAGESGVDISVSKALGEFGRKLGLAFQIQDDLLDLVGEESLVGKTLGKDLEKRKLTLPIILYFEDAAAGDREEMLSLLGGSGDVGDSPENEISVKSALRDRLVASGAVRRAHETAERLIEEARKRLSELADSPARAVLFEMAAAVVSRRF